LEFLVEDLKMENETLCRICQKARVSSGVVDGYSFDKCLDCAIGHMEKSRTEFVAMLVSDEQAIAFHEYEKATDERLAMQIVMIR
jgi:hypothetical protein